MVSHTDVLLNPLENAIVSLEEKHRELKRKISAVAKIPDETADQSFTMAINGASTGSLP